MNQDSSNERSPWHHAAVTVYSTLLTVAAAFIAYCLYLSFASMNWVVIVPLMSATFVFCRWRVLALAIPAVVFFVIGISSIEAMDYGQQLVGSLPLGMACLILIACTMRYQVFAHHEATTHLVIPPTRKHGTVESRFATSFHIEELASLILIPIAWAISAFTVRLMSNGLSQAQSEYGLLPQGLLAVKMTLALAFLFLVFQGALGYCRSRCRDRVGASMVLRQEIWKWNGQEQRVVAKRRQVHPSPGPRAGGKTIEA